MVMRQKVWIDRHVQGVLVGRVVLYWSGILIYFGLSVGGYHWWQNPEWTLTEHLWGFFEQVGPCLPTLLLLLPLVIFDIVRLSHKFAGPIYRLRTHLTSLNQNAEIAPLNFRDDDYWQQLADPINQLQQKVLTLQQQMQALMFVHKSVLQGGLPTNPTGLVEQSQLVDVSQPTQDSVVSEAAVPLAVATGEAPAAEPFVTSA